MPTGLGLNAKFGLDGTEFAKGLTGINSQLKLVQAEFKEAGSKVAEFGTSGEKISGLNRQIDLQKAKLEELNSRYLQAVEKNGEASGAAMKYATEISKAKTALGGLETELTTTNKTIESQKTSWSGLTTKVQEASQKGQGHILNLKNAVIGLAATAAGGAGLFSLAEGAINAGDSAYQLSEKLHMTAADAGLLNKELTLADTSSTTFTSTMLKLDKGVEGAGVKGNATTKALKEYGVTLTDSTGKLLPYNDQLKALADGYQKAADNGNEEAYVSQVLGNRGQDLVGILSNYTTVATEASKIKGIGIDPEQAHKVKMEMEALSMQVKQIGYTFGNALIPIVAQVLPPLQAAFTNLAQTIKDHEADIKQFTQNLLDIGTTFGQLVLPVLTAGFNFIKDNGVAAKVIVVALVAAFAAFKTVTTIIEGVTAAQKAWAEATKLLQGAQMALNLVMEANPFGIVILVIAALTAAFILLYNNYKPFHDFINNSFKVISSGAASMGKAVGDVITNLGNTFKNLPAQAAQWGSDFIQGFIKGITSMVSGVTTAVSNIANTIKSFLHFSVPDQGPLTDYETWMPDFMGGLSDGINKNKHLVTQAIKGVATDMTIGVKAPSSSGTNNAITNTSGNNSTAGSSLTVNIANFVNNRAQDVQAFAEELEFYRKQQNAGTGVV